MRIHRFHLVIALLSIMLLSACAPVISKPPLERRHYLLATDRPESPAGHLPLDAVLAVRSLRVAAGFDSKSFVTIRSDGRVEADFHHHFFLPPGEMITGQIRGWFRNAGLFSHVTDLSSLKDPDYVLEGFVPLLARDSSGPAPSAVMAIQFLLLRPGRDAAVEVVLQRDYLAGVVLRDESPRELVRGWNEALTGILMDFEADLREALGISPSASSGGHGPP